jgi:hypothetical protein
MRSLVLFFLVFLPEQPVPVWESAEVGPAVAEAGNWADATADAAWDPRMAYEADQGRQLADALAGKTRQADRVARAIEEGRILVHVLSDDEFDARYAVVGGKSYALAFAYGREIFIRAGSPSTLSDLVHEGTHTLDYQVGFWRGRRILELRAYAYEHEFQKATGGEVQFVNLLEVLRFVWKY